MEHSAALCQQIRHDNESMLLSFHSGLIGRLLLAVGVVVGLSSCSAENTQKAPAATANESLGTDYTTTEDVSMNNKTVFELHILEGDWLSLKLGHELQQAWATLQQTYASATAFTLTEDDIEHYNWSEQVITLTPASSTALVSKFAETEEELQYPEATLDQRAFVVVVNGNPVYGGVFLHPMSSMAIKYPVIYVTTGEGKIVFKLRPIHSVLGKYSGLEPLWNGIKDPKIEDVFTKAGKLVK